MSHFLQVSPPRTASKNCKWFMSPSADPQNAKRYLTLHSKQNSKKNGYRYDYPTLVAHSPPTLLPSINLRRTEVAPAVWQKVRYPEDSGQPTNHTTDR